MEGSFFYCLESVCIYQTTGTAEGQELETMADDKYSKERVLQASRGEILDTNGDVIARGYIQL